MPSSGTNITPNSSEDSHNKRPSVEMPIPSGRAGPVQLPHIKQPQSTVAADSKYVYYMVYYHTGPKYLSGLSLSLEP
jgi:hypothetical protein